MPLSGPKTRKRSENFFLGDGHLVQTWVGYPGGKLEYKGQIPNYKGTQITVSEGHPFQGRRKATGDIGGDFFTQRSYPVLNRPDQAAKRVTKFSDGTTHTTQFTGAVFPVQPESVSYPPPMNSSNAELNAWGAKAIARCKPTNSVADVSVAIAEIMREALPSMLGIHTWKARNRKIDDDLRKAGKPLSQDYLNLQFGWKPLVSEIRSVADALSRAEDILSQYERDSGRMVRRKYHFPTSGSRSETTTNFGVGAFYGPSSSDLSDATYRGDLVRVREKTQRRWFSGAFTYYLPSGYDSRSAMARNALMAKKLLGTTPTPDTLWNLAPWSWAIDWFTNTGDVISNLTDWAYDGLLMRYGYIMEHTYVRDTYTLVRGTGLIDRSVSVPPFSLVTETKIRRRANPFGFGLTWDGLSPFQLSIAAALGLTRS